MAAAIPGVTPISATNNGQSVNLWQATPGYFPNYPTFLQTYGGQPAPYADIGSEILDQMQNSGLLGGAPPNPYGGNNMPRYQFGKSAIATNQVPATMGQGVPHGLLGSAAQSSIFNQYLPTVSGSVAGQPNVPQGGGAVAPPTNSAPPGGLLTGGGAPATPVPPSTGDKPGSKVLPISDPSSTVNMTNGQSPGATFTSLISALNALPNDAAKFHFLETTGSGLLGGGMNALAQADFGGSTDALRQWQQATQGSTMNGAYDPTTGTYLPWYTGK